jgi:hypothetical protein
MQEFDDLKRDLPHHTMLNEALIASLPRATISLRKAVTKKKDELAKPLWQEAFFAVHIQDSRLSERERQVLVAIGTRLYGVRAIS